MDFSNEQLEFIKIHMELCIKDCHKSIDKYGCNDEATAGCGNAIELAQSIIDKIDKKKGFLIKDAESVAISDGNGNILAEYHIKSS